MQRQSSAHSICGRALGRLGLRSLGTSGSAEGSRLCRSPRRFCCMSLTSWDRPRKIFALFWMVPTEETKVPRAPVGASVCWLQMPTMKSWSACPQTQQQHHAEHRRARSKLHSWAGFRRGLWLAWYMASAAGLSTSCSSAALPYPTACCCRYFAFVFLRAFSGRRQKRVGDTKSPGTVESRIGCWGDVLPDLLVLRRQPPERADHRRMLVRQVPLVPLLFAQAHLLMRSLTRREGLGAQDADAGSSPRRW